MSRRRYIKGQLRLDTLLAFVFGVLFVGAILYFTVTVVNPSPYQMQTFKTVLALAAAGVAAMIPGQFEFRHLPFVRAGGAIAVFALVFLTPMQLVSSVAQFEEPAGDPAPVIQQYLEAADRGDYTALWRQIDPAAPEWFQISREGWSEIYQNARAPFGQVLARRVVSRGGARNPDGYPPGIYRHVLYLTKFSNGRACTPETVVVRATDDLRWRVFSHQVAFNEMPCVGMNLPEGGPTR